MCFGSWWWMISETKSRAEMIKSLYGRIQHYPRGLRSLVVILREVEKRERPDNSLLLQHSLSLQVNSAADNLIINVVITTMDNGMSHDASVYKDMTLGWWLKSFVLISILEPIHPVITTYTQLYRVIHKGRTLFLSSSGKKTLHELGIKKGDELIIGGIHSDGSERATNEKPKENRSTKTLQSTLPDYFGSADTGPMV